MKGTIAKLIAFVVVCSIFTGYLFVTIGNLKPLRDQYTLTATFDDVTGLLPDDNVKVAGVVVGKVTGISVERAKAKVTFTVDKSVKIPSDSSAAIRWRNLLGQRYVYLYPGEATTALRSGQAVPKTRSVVDLGELFNRLGPIVKAIDPAKVNQFLDAVVMALDGNEEQLRRALTDLGTLAAGLATRDEAIGRLIENTNTVAGTIQKREVEIRQVLDNLVQISATFSANTDVLDRAVTELGEFSGHMDAILGSNRGHIDALLNNLMTLTDVVESKLPVLDEAVLNLDDAATRLFAASRYGEMLNQTIPCGASGYPDRENLPPTCEPDPAPTSAGAARRPAASNADAVLELFGGAG